MLTGVWNALQDSVAVLDHSGRIVAVNQAWRDFGARNGLLDADASLSANYLQICERAVGADYPTTQNAAEGIRQVLAGERPSFELEYPCHSPEQERWFLLRATRFVSNRQPYVAVVHEDISERYRSDQERETTIEMLRLINTSSSAAELARAVAGYLQRDLGWEAVGIRLRRGDDYPYCETRGFAAKYFGDKNLSCGIAAAGCLRIDGAGRPIPACIHRGVIAGQFDPASACFSAKGSFRINHLSELLASRADAATPSGGIAASLCGRCLAAGYESMALISLRFGAECLGLMELYDHRPGRLGSAALATWERIADQVSIALSNFRTHEELRRSRALLQSIVEGTSDAIFTKDMQGRYTMCNTAAAGFLGIESTEILGKDPTALFLPAVARQIMADDLAVVTSQAVRTFEETINTPSGMMTFLSTKGPLRDTQGNSVGCFGISRDITARKQAEDRLRRSEADLADAQALARVGNWQVVWNDGQESWSCSDEAYRIWGNPLGMPITMETGMARIHPDDRARVEAEWRAAVQSGGTSEGEHRIIVDGKVKWIHEKCQVTHDAAGKPREIRGTCQDITELKFAQAAMRESENRYRSLFNVMNEGFALHELILDDQGRPVDYRFLDLNPAFERLTGLRRENIIGKKFSEVLPDEDPQWVQLYGEVTLTGKPMRAERFSPALQRHFSILAYRTAELHFAVFFMDVTQRRNAQAEAARHREAVAHMARLNAMGQMATGLAHELNQPLTAVRNYVHYCKALLESGKTQAVDLPEALDKIDQSAARAAAIIQRLREFVRKQEPTREPAALAPVIMRVLDLMAPILQRARVRVQTEISGQLPPARIDLVQIEQVLVNLVQNAVDAMSETPEEMRLLTVRAFAGPAAESIRLEIDDRGCGIKPEEASHIFEEFFTTKSEGLGLGLAITKNIVESHGGQLTVLANPAGGTVFVMSLPATKGN